MKPENNGATFPSFLLAKVKDLPAEVSTLGKPLNEKPQANKASLCAFKHHVRRVSQPPPLLPAGSAGKSQPSAAGHPANP